MCSEIDIFQQKCFLERFEGFLKLKIDFENQILALFDLCFWPFNKSHEKINAIFVISAIIAWIRNVFIKCHRHDEKLTYIGAMQNLFFSFFIKIFSITPFMWRYRIGVEKIILLDTIVADITICNTSNEIRKKVKLSDNVS